MIHIGVVETENSENLIADLSMEVLSTITVF